MNAMRAGRYVAAALLGLALAGRAQAAEVVCAVPVVVEPEAAPPQFSNFPAQGGALPRPPVKHG